MLIPLTRKKFEELIPTIATGNQYKHYWGKFPDFLRRLLISVIGVVVAFFARIATLGSSSGILIFAVGITVGTYWLWGPIFWASRRNASYRKHPYSGFWKGRVLDVYVTDDVVGTEETVNSRGELVIVENRERRLNLEVGDKTGFYTELQVPIRRDYRAIRPGQVALMLVMSDRPDLSRILQTSDVYIPKLKLWVSDYPCVRRDVFEEVSQTLRQRRTRSPSEGRSARRPARSRMEYDPY
ncbi:phosphate ABC transporter permease [Desertifilum sp. FACHB-1129]|uniref:Phosphate ABC transporter permease n=2 Tax=Cyanophyceae TaxID=3028117 RepID=A0A1E5QDY9_9CYAN|nr:MULTISPECIES: phosphate ABC transporter permease [Cyanophyceae]MDA0209100.1 phosphate ABC transporter permease [Cyanobacteria bacterium FC1]MDI9634902.1 phosphate ABC transporter permease [Geitlerinema splendidum]MBD2310583.1 phosphate ABC transporter permease [Desertifilum sp. FACHB-1129]MBD2322035.1 phosphate ABC transporter permease [Desertifilum sp. FACHB-866]MBD2332162.1 phosphate ABC transporter permease [Desertifilum sp. FACHB-868]